MAVKIAVNSTSYGVMKNITTEIEVNINVDDVLGFITECNNDEKDKIKDAIDWEEPEVEVDDLHTHLSREVLVLLEQCGKTLDEDEKLIYFLTNIEDISLEQLKEATSGQQV